VSVSDETLLSHLDAAYNLARWLMGNSADAEDVVQDAYVRALAGAEQFRGGDPRACLQFKLRVLTAQRWRGSAARVVVGD
jgi:RNA polymerase sigma-70 factor (ECF subfamily)